MNEKRQYSDAKLEIIQFYKTDIISTSNASGLEDDSGWTD